MWTVSQRWLHESGWGRTKSKSLLRGGKTALLGSEEVIQEIFAPVLIAGLCNSFLIHDVVVGVVSLPRLLLMLPRYTSFFLALEESQLRCNLLVYEDYREMNARIPGVNSIRSLDQ